MASYETGYEDELFQYPVGPSFHCCICTNVIKDPVMCDNEHIFCKACITRHLTNSQTCPTCMQPLTVETLREVPRGIKNLLSELKIRCEFFDRGCGKIIQLGDLKRHVTDCGFAPAVCSNEGCQLQINKQDLLHHETAVCELRRVQCHSCNDIRREMDAMKISLAAINEKLARNEKHFQEILRSNLENFTAVVETVTSEVQKQLNNKQEESNRQLKEDNVEMKKSLNEITKQLEKMTQQTSHEVKVGNMKKGITEADEVDREPKVVVVGGRNKNVLNSVEMFSLANKTWTRLQKMRENRMGATAVAHNNQIFVSGGHNGNGRIKSFEKLSLNAVDVDQSIPWENFPAELFVQVVGHRSVVYNGRLIIIGGFDDKISACSDNITEVSFVPPYASKHLTSIPQKRCYHGVAVFGDKILIVAGRESGASTSAVRSVVMYDITKNECQELAPLPYPICDMATVKWDDDSALIMGGSDGNDKPLNKVLMYNIKTQKIQMLPDMKYMRQGCVAAVVRDTVIAMGGQGKIGKYLKSVESFKFDRYSWEELPEMHEARCWATAVAC